MTDFKNMPMVYCDANHPVISEESREWIRARRETPAFGNNGFTLDEVRAAMTGRFEPADIAFRNLPAQLGGIPGEWVWTDGADPDVRLLYIHGGGFISGSPDIYIAQAARISKAAGCAVFLVDYRLAPEHPFPAGLEDCVQAYQAIKTESPSGPSPATATFIAGDSAGGGLTLSTLLTLRDRGLPLSDAAIPISPFADLTLTAASIRSQGELDPIMHPGCLPGFVRHYIGDYTNVRHPYISSAFADYTGLPPLLLQVGEHEIILDDSVLVATRAREAGVRVILEVWGGMFHVFQCREPALPETTAAIKHIADFIHSCLLARATDS